MNQVARQFRPGRLCLPITYFISLVTVGVIGGSLMQIWQARESADGSLLPEFAVREVRNDRDVERQTNEEATSPIDFDTDIVPILTKSGCNAASCHGAANGRGGFRLSLFGGDPKSDHSSITRELQGRRVNLAAPERSLLLRKPIGDATHEGGIRFESDSLEATLLSEWISQGATRFEQRQLQTLVVSPEAIVLDDVDQSQPLTITAQFTDGTARDVTDWAVITPDDPTAVQIEPGGIVSVNRRGRFHVCIQYLSSQMLVPITIPVTTDSQAISPSPESSWIDREIDTSLQQLGLHAAETAPSNKLVRRLTLSLTGRLPSSEQLHLLTDSDDNVQYERLVDSIIQSREFERYWTYRMLQTWRVSAPVNEPQVAEAIQAWFGDAIAEDESLLDLVSEMVVANGDTHVSGAAGIHRLTGGARDQAEYFSEVVMGVRLRCANCHDHPLDRWKQDDYHGLAAIFAKVGRGRAIRQLPNGEVTHPRTGEAAEAKLPGEAFLDQENDGRESLAQWIQSEPERYFARATVNRVWKALFGVGIVESADDLRVSNPASHPELLAELAQFFIENDYRLRPLIREIVLSNAYKRDSDANATNLDTRFLASFPITVMEPAVLLDAIAFATDTEPNVSDGYADGWAIDLPNPSSPSAALDLLGRCPTGESCVDAASDSQIGLPAILHMINGELLNDRIVAQEGRLQRLIASDHAPMEIVEELYRVGYARAPTSRERQFWQRHLDQAFDEATGEVLEDFWWSVLSSTEFRTNH